MQRDYPSPGMSPNCERQFGDMPSSSARGEEGYSAASAVRFLPPGLLSSSSFKNCPV